MGKLSSADADLLREARERFQAGIDADHDNRKRDEEDRKFFKGEQWSKEDIAARAGRPTVTINRLPQFVKQVTGEMRQNKPAIKVLPVDDNTDPKLAEVHSAIIRHIESISDAHRTYAKSAEQACIGGLGWYRILTEYLDEQSFEQEILVKHIRNPLSVVVDPDARELCKSDMNWGFVTELVSKKKFQKLYPGASLTGFESPNEEYSQWINGDFVRVAEYWYREAEKKKLALFSDGSTRFYEKGDDELIRQANEQRVAQGLKPLEIARMRDVDAFRVRSCLISGVAKLDEGTEWKGKWIPLVPVVGEEVEVGDAVFRHGMIHHSKDAQRSYNYSRSAMIERIGNEPKAPWLVTADHIKNYKTMWENANKGNPPVLVYDPDPKAPAGPQRMQQPQMATAWYQEAQVADQDMKATTGIYDASLGKQSNETSGRAIIARERQGDTATFVYIDNLSAAIRHTGNILIDLIPHIYSDERVIRIVGEDGSIEEYAKINSRLPDGRVFNDISQGRYDVEVTTGPAYATKRQEAADSMIQFVQAVPAAGQVAADLIAKSMDWPNADKLAERLQMILPPGIDPEADQKRMKAQMEMQQMMGPQPPDPMQEAMAAEQVGKARKVNAEADRIEVQAQNEQIRPLMDGMRLGMQGDSPSSPPGA
jgi:hypothetical protein